MATKPPVVGHLAQFVEPEWGPLTTVIGHELAAWFMWMGEIELIDNTRIHAFKHVTTRRYLHLDSRGHAFEFRAEGEYREIALSVAISRAFVGWEQAAPLDRDMRALRAVVDRARGRR